ncbi:MAG: hypothetical protein Q7V09_12265 [Hydrogenophaga sp.]|uniref:hypothetical protein n=1 Tax=Hydrogenophaga sp. TaxID=1904254 RepID=UPI002721F601|nr:hypothetical protein [Hydrogenophaga sp.]MDO9031203.1 hypothetical protein [Hydrogenophaga sp.]
MDNQKSTQDRNHQQTTEALESIIPKFGSVIGIFSAATLALSVFYDFSYLAALHLDFGEVQTSLSDHVRSAVVWLPTVVVGIAFLALVERSLRSYFGPYHGSPEKLSTEDIKARKKFLVWNDRLLLISTTVTIFSFAAMKTGTAYYAIFFIAWSFLSMTLAIRIPFRQYIANKWNIAIAIIPIVAAAIGALGYFTAESAIDKKSAVWRLTVSPGMNSPNEILEAKLLRRFSSMSVVVTMKNQIRLVPEESIKQAEKLSEIEPKSIISVIEELTNATDSNSSKGKRSDTLTNTQTAQ